MNLKFWIHPVLNLPNNGSWWLSGVKGAKIELQISPFTVYLMIILSQRKCVRMSVINIYSCQSVSWTLEEDVKLLG